MFTLCRPDKPFKIVLLSEIANNVKIEDNVLEEYERTRDFDIISEYVEKYNLHTFEILPLLVENEYLVDRAIGNETEAARIITQQHLMSMDGPSVLSLNPKKEHNRSRLVYTRETIDKLPRLVVIEIARVIIESSRGDDNPFSRSDTWRESRKRAKIIVMEKNALSKIENINVKKD